MSKVFKIVFKVVGILIAAIIGILAFAYLTLRIWFDNAWH